MVLDRDNVGGVNAGDGEGGKHNGTITSGSLQYNSSVEMETMVVVMVVCGGGGGSDGSVWWWWL